ncbi:hypothetical protein JHK85_040217 [Glycine max]|nr:hypothetical protein JHK85_040217 [Glycine max]
MKELEEEKKQSLQAWKKELKDAIITDIFNGDNDLAPANFDLNVLGARVSTKESNTEIAVNPSGEMHVGRVTPPMGLYVQKLLFKELLLAGADPHAVDDEGESVLHRAFAKNSIDCALVILENGGSRSMAILNSKNMISLYENGTFCKAFHKESDGWRDCVACYKEIVLSADMQCEKCQKRVADIITKMNENPQCNVHNHNLDRYTICLQHEGVG